MGPAALSEAPFVQAVEHSAASKEGPLNSPVPRSEVAYPEQLARCSFVGEVGYTPALSPVAVSAVGRDHRVANTNRLVVIPTARQFQFLGATKSN